MTSKKPLNRFWNRNPFFYKVRNALLFRNITKEELSDISYNTYNPIESIPEIYHESNKLIFKNTKEDLTDFDKAITIATWLRNNVRGGKGLGTNSTDALKLMLHGGYGVCSDFCQVYNNFCVINNLKVREWGLKKIGSHVDGHAFNEFYSKELDKWIFIDVSKSLFFVQSDDPDKVPISVLDLYPVDGKKLNIKSVCFNARFSQEDKMIDKFYFSDMYKAFVIDNYVNSLYDKYLTRYEKFPIPFIHGMLILLNKSYVYKRIT